MPVALSTGHDWGIGGCLGRISTGQEVQRSMQHVKICLEVRWLMMFPFRKLNVTFRFVWRYAGLLGFLGVFLGGRFPSGTAKMGSNLRRFFKFSWKMSPLLAKFTQAHRISMDSFEVSVEVPNFLLVHRVWNWFHCKSKPHVIHRTIIKLMASG